ncbi:bifunctional adenosylcobinamide kinase/adenosylcobinamide-phosphate guanylyltransferase [uncultured Clostridium sp.]|uniref:bifunctional adenosylcobinamide kinase/adenosylcobinamide-phosphate guanylyltransferase n=1 Tax=uncultured Clostridium sp. TaxID=59620 RepID=UPI00261C258D|nr:bifunctional adenosylcobinamide kinase/adenosylcobinamide-phosphate guanylyltransferase [uncultured Clostridium sp.]
MIIFISGGSKSGKSRIGESFSKTLHKEGDLYYLATMKPMGNEDIRKIENHKKDRIGTSFKAVEINYNIEKAGEFLKEEDTVLLDSITSLVANEMFKGELLLEEEDIEKKVSKKIFKEVENLSLKVRNLIIVSDYIFSDSLIYDPITENYKRELGNINTGLSKLSDISIYVSYGVMEIFKGKEFLENEGLI